MILAGDRQNAEAFDGSAKARRRWREHGEFDGQHLVVRIQVTRCGKYSFAALHVSALLQDARQRNRRLHTIRACQMDALKA